MEIPGVDLQFACNSCICANCLRGNIHPKGDNTCPQGCVNCNAQSPKSKEMCDFKLSEEV